MIVQQFKSDDKTPIAALALPAGTDLLLVFGARHLLCAADFFPILRAACPSACIVGCSTAGEIMQTEVTDDTVVLTAVTFDGTTVRMAVGEISEAEGSQAIGDTISRHLLAPDLVHILVLSDGLRINGSELVQGLRAPLPAHVNVTGGLAADGTGFGETVVLANGPAQSGQIVGIGFYGSGLKVGYGSVGGWDTFGPRRQVTKSESNVLYELDGESALQLYKTYLGPHAAELPTSGLLFPLAVRLSDADTPVVRTLLSVDEAGQSMTFAGDLPVGSEVQLMKANFNRLVDGAVSAAKVTQGQLEGGQAQLAVLISCIGRKLVLQQRIEEEVESVAEILGEQAALTGFYSYGELAPHGALTRCELHNQTMTVTTFLEV